MKNQSKRIRLCIVGQSGSGLLSVGEIITKTLRNLGFYVIADREYPSLIKGGHSCFTINFSSEPLHSLDKNCEVFVSIDKPSLVAYFDRLTDGGTWIHGYERLAGIKDIIEQAAQRNIEVINLPTRTMAEDIGGHEIMQNVILVGMVWRALEMPLGAVMSEIEHRFAKKPKLLPANFECTKVGYEGVNRLPYVYPYKVPNPLKTSWFRLEPLGESHTEEDYEVVNRNRKYLQNHSHKPVTRCFSWPEPELDLAANQQDFRQHQAEFEAKTDFTYVVRGHNKQYLGCVYICPKAFATNVYLWLQEGYQDQEIELVEDIRQWLAAKWKLFNVVFPAWDPKGWVIDGNHAIALGAIAGGVKAYYAYPMSPSSTILTHMANYAKDADVLVKQAEDEITVAQLTMGSSFAGTRSMCATSGGGFDLMTETVSLAGMIEVPWVCAIAQRPGPATGLPTWTAQADLNIAAFGGHGEYTRLVVAVSDPESAFDLTQRALNYADEFQIPVMILTEKQIAESHVTVSPFNEGVVPIERHLVTGEDVKKVQSEDRYKLTETGVSPRWLPASNPKAYYFANGDEHDSMGRLDEEESTGDMIQKRIRKEKALLEALPEPTVYGEGQKARISFVGWGSSKGVMLDLIQHFKNQKVSVNYLHFDYVFPLKTETLNAFVRANKNVHLIENNATGQLGNLIEQKTDVRFKNRCLKWDGRPFYFEEMVEYVENHKC